MFVLGSHITIGKYSFKGVHEVRVKRSMRTYDDTALIVLPATSTIVKRSDPNYKQTVETGKQFNEGDKVIINLGYNGNLRQEFKGFVKRVNFNTPCEIECEGYSWQMKRNNVNKYWKTTTVKEVLTEAIKGTDIKLEVADNMPITNLKVNNSTGAATLNYVINKVSEGILTAFFIKSDTLWVGLKYTAYRNTVKYVLGRNVIRENQLKLLLADNTKLAVEFVLPKDNGHKVKISKSSGAGVVKQILLNHVRDEQWAKRLAETYLEKNAHNGYDGKLNCLLQPFTEPGDKINLFDPKYSERDGSYLAETVEVIYGNNGARRIVDIGIKIAS